MEGILFKDSIIEKNIIEKSVFLILKVCNDSLMIKRHTWTNLSKKFGKVQIVSEDLRKERLLQCSLSVLIYQKKESWDDYYVENWSNLSVHTLNQKLNTER